jgi:hypothetical protein
MSSVLTFDFRITQPTPAAEPKEMKDEKSKEG